MTNFQFWFVEFITRFLQAQAAFEEAIQSVIPAGMPIKVRQNGGGCITSVDDKYKFAFEKFVEEVSDQRSILILFILYQMEKYYAPSDFSIFAKAFKDRFSDDKWETIKYNFPRIDQTTLATMIDEFSASFVAVRLEDLESIGLVVRTALKPPNPKHVQISSKGIRLIEAACTQANILISPAIDRADIHEAEKLTGNTSTSSINDRSA